MTIASATSGKRHLRALAVLAALAWLSGCSEPVEPAGSEVFPFTTPRPA